MACALAAPVVNNIKIKAVTSGAGAGSIEVVAGEDEWSYEWVELTDEVKQHVSKNILFEVVKKIIVKKFLKDKCRKIF